MSDRRRLRSARLLSALLLALVVVGEGGTFLRSRRAVAGRDAVLARARPYRPQIVPVAVHPSRDALPATRPVAPPLALGLPIPAIPPASRPGAIAPDHRPDYPRPPPFPA